MTIKVISPLQNYLWQRRERGTWCPLELLAEVAACPLMSKLCFHSEGTPDFEVRRLLTSQNTKYISQHPLLLGVAIKLFCQTSWRWVGSLSHFGPCGEGQYCEYPERTVLTPLAPDHPDCNPQCETMYHFIIKYNNWAILFWKKRFKHPNHHYYDPHTKTSIEVEEWWLFYWFTGNELIALACLSVSKCGEEVNRRSFATKSKTLRSTEQGGSQGWWEGFIQELST